MTRQQMFYYLTRNNISLDPCNMQEENNGSVCYLSINEMKNMVNNFIQKQKEQIKKDNETRKETILPGDKITALGYTFTVNDILYQHFYHDGDGFDCEFIDTKGNYHHWKQWEDKGYISRWNGKQYVKID